MEQNAELSYKSKKFLKSEYSGEKKYRHMKQPDFFSHLLNTLVYVINSTYGIYLVFNLVFCSYYYFLGKDFMSNWKELESLFTDNFYNMTLITTFIFFGIFSVKKKSFLLFSVYICLLLLINVNYFIGNDTASANLNIISSIISKSFKLTLIATNFIFFLYSSYFYCLTIGYFQYDLSDLPISLVINEIKLRTDMMKMNYNSFMINTVIYKYLPGLLYKKEDYYFMGNTDENGCDEINRPINNKDKWNNSNVSDENLNSKSTIDSECQPLRY